MFITLEGGEGSGKSTLLRALSTRLSADGLNVVTTREPGGTPLAEAIRNLALHPPGDTSFSPLAEALLMNAARDDHLKELIRPALKRGDWVLCDRFADSTRVYQGLAGGISPSLLHLIENDVIGPTSPDLTLVLDIPVEVAAQRRIDRGAPVDVFERRDSDFHSNVRSAFLQIADENPMRVKTIDASQTVQNVFETAWALISDLRETAANS